MALYEINADANRGSGLFFKGKAGEAVVRGNLIYKGADGQWFLADADAVASMLAIGMALDVASVAGQIIRILTPGGFMGRVDWTWTTGGTLYASTVAGELTQVIPAGPGDVVQVVGMATKTTQIQFNPQGGGAGASTASNVLEGSTAFVGTDATKAGFVNYFVIDGVADNVQIDAAINYVDGLGGGSVELERGDYTIAATVTMDENDIVLKGQGWDTHIIGALVATAITVSGDRCMILDLQCSTTAGGTNVFDAISITGDNCVVERVWVPESDRHGILANGPFAKIQHNFIETVDDNFVSIGALGDGSIVSNNDMDTSGADGVLIDVAGLGCHVSDNRIVSWTGEPVDDNSVNSSTVENNWAGGTVLTSKGCSMATIALALTYVGANGWVEVPGGTWTENVTIAAADVILRGQGWDSIIDGTTSSAVLISGARCSLRDIQVTTNQVGNVAFGVNVGGGGTFARIIGVFVNGCDSSGIAISEADCLVDGCYVFDPDEDGILANAARARMVGNIISTAGASGVSVTATGDDSVIDGNIIDITGADGIVIAADGENVVVKGNRIMNFTGEALDDDSETAIIPKASFQFTEAVNGAIVTTSPTGVDVDANTEAALAWGQIPQEAQGVTRIRIWGVATDAPINAGGQMHLEVTFNAGASNAAYNTAAKSWSLTDYDSEEADYVANDVVHWNIDNADVGGELANLAPGDSFEIFAIHEAGADPDGATDCLFRVVEIEYV